MPLAIVSGCEVRQRGWVTKVQFPLWGSSSNPAPTWKPFEIASSNAQFNTKIPVPLWVRADRMVCHANASPPFPVQQLALFPNKKRDFGKAALNSLGHLGCLAKIGTPNVSLIVFLSKEIRLPFLLLLEGSLKVLIVCISCSHQPTPNARLWIELSPVHTSITACLLQKLFPTSQTVQFARGASIQRCGRDFGLVSRSSTSSRTRSWKKSWISWL